jgi:hypothetical protein
VESAVELILSLDYRQVVQYGRDVLWGPFGRCF